MPTTFGQANIAFGGASFTFGEFSVAYELSLVKDGKASRKELFKRMFNREPEKKKKVINKGENKIKYFRIVYFKKNKKVLKGMFDFKKNGTKE